MPSFSRGCIQGYVCCGLTPAPKHHIAVLLPFPGGMGRELEG